MSHLPSIADMSPEQRAEMRHKAEEAKRLKGEWAEANLKLDFADESHWRALASHYGMRMPPWYEKASGKYVQRFLKQFDKDAEWYTSHTGFKNGNEEARVCKDLPAYAQIGLLLEVYDDELKRNR